MRTGSVMWVLPKPCVTNTECNQFIKKKNHPNDLDYFDFRYTSVPIDNDADVAQ